MFIGGGYAGLEGIAELAGFARDAIRRYPRCREAGTRFTLIDVAARVMPEIQQAARGLDGRAAAERGIEFRLETTVAEVRDRHVLLSTGETLSCSHRRLDGGRAGEPGGLAPRAAARARPDRV